MSAPHPIAALPPAALQAFGLAVATLAAELAANIVEERLSRAQHPLYATAKHNPLGSPRQFRDAARRGAFKTMKVGRELRAKWADVEAYVDSCPAQTRKAPPAAEPSLDDMLTQAATPRRSRKAS